MLRKVFLPNARVGLEEHLAVFVVVQVVDELARDRLVVAAVLVDLPDLHQPVAPRLLSGVDLGLGDRMLLGRVPRRPSGMGVPDPTATTTAIPNHLRRTLEIPNRMGPTPQKVVALNLGSPKCGLG